MLKITIDVKSGIKEFIVPQKVKGSYIEKFMLQHNPENRHKFLHGILLYLMGERISLHALDGKENDANWLQAKKKLTDFLRGC